MEARCFRKGCEFTEDVPHMDAAVDTLREHYRAQHPTKSFVELDNRSGLETWNTTVDEWLTEVCVGPDGTTNFGYLNEYLRGYMGADRMPPAVRDDLQQVYDNWVQAQQAAQPQVAGLMEFVEDDVAAPAAPRPLRFRNGR